MAGENSAADEARTMLNIFASVGGRRFDVTWTNAAGEKERFRRAVSLAELIRTIPAILDLASQQQRNVIIRPEGDGVTFVQLDDIKADILPRLAPVFLILETSPANWQAWLALPGAEAKEFTRRVKRGTGADVTASGAGRIAGSINFKSKYAPDFPRVWIRTAQAGRMTSKAEMERLGLVAPPEEFAPLRMASARRHSGGERPWPRYAIALEGAPLNSEGTGPDTSKADIVWCMTAITWGFGVEETARRLMEEPESKAFIRGENYAIATAKKAALYVAQRRRISK